MRGKRFVYGSYRGRRSTTDVLKTIALIDLPRIGPGPLQKGPPGPHSEGDVAAADGEQGQTRRELELLHQPLREGQLPLWRDGEPAVGPPLIGQ